MKHAIQSPYPAALFDDGAVVLDEKCLCGHLCSEHADTISYGHGFCGECGCIRFAWVDFVVQNTNEEEEAVNQNTEESHDE